MSCPQCGAVLNKPKRGFFGKISIILFWLFNAFMVFVIWAGVSGTSEEAQGLTGAEATGYAIGTGIGVSLLVLIWLVGAIILGLMALLTRPRGG